LESYDATPSEASGSPFELIAEEDKKKNSYASMWGVERSSDTSLKLCAISQRTLKQGLSYVNTTTVTNPLREVMP